MDTISKCILMLIMLGLLTFFTHTFMAWTGSTVIVLIFLAMVVQYAVSVIVINSIVLSYTQTVRQQICSNCYTNLARRRRRRRGGRRAARRRRRGKRVLPWLDETRQDAGLDTIQHILKYINFRERGNTALGLSSRSCRGDIGLQLIESFCWGGRDVTRRATLRRRVVLCESAGAFLLRQPGFADRRDEKGFVLKLVEHSGCALKYASLELRKDRDVVLAAVKQDGRALEYADPEMKKDREIVLAHVKQDWRALRWADPQVSII